MEQDVNEGVTDYVLFRLQQASNHLSRLAASVDLDVSNEVQTSLAQVKSILADTDVNTKGLVGRPKFEMSRDQLQYLVDYSLLRPKNFQHL